MICVSSLSASKFCARCVLAIAGLTFGCSDHESAGPARSATLGAGGGPTGLSADSADSADSFGRWFLRKRRGIQHVLLISVDGLAARFLGQLLSANRLPAFARLERLGAFTRNARADPTHTFTLPNHVSMLTGLPVIAPSGGPPERGHGYTSNGSPGADTVHDSGNPARTYTPSVFDVVHDHGLSTAMFASKSKFDLFTNSYNVAGAADQVGADHGSRKIDVVEISEDLTELTDALLGALVQAPPNFGFVHFSQPDSAGHALGWGSAEYLEAIADVDVALGRILTLIESDPRLARTAVILTADHGGTGSSHFDPADPDNFVIPFYVLGPGISGGRDLYSLVGSQRTEPGSTENPGFEPRDQPIRNGDSGNLALALLGFGPVPGSSMHSFGLAPGFTAVTFPLRADD